MDNIVKQARSEADERFDTARIATAVTALATEYAGREDVFRAAVAKLLKAEMFATAKGVNSQTLVDAIFMEAIGNAIQAHHADPVLIHGVIESEAQKAFAAKIADLTK